MTRNAGAKLLALAGKSVDELLAASDKPDFQPIPLDIAIRGHLRSKVRELEHAQRGRHRARQRPRAEARGA